jgi:hypothetical protein
MNAIPRPEENHKRYPILERSPASRTSFRCPDSGSSSPPRESLVRHTGGLTRDSALGWCVCGSVVVSWSVSVRTSFRQIPSAPLYDSPAFWGTNWPAYSQLLHCYQRLILTAKCQEKTSYLMTNKGGRCERPVLWISNGTGKADYHRPGWAFGTLEMSCHISSRRLGACARVQLYPMLPYRTSNRIQLGTSTSRDRK